MRTVIRSLTLLIAMVCMTDGGLHGDEKKITPEQIDKAISQLSDKRYAVREKAAKLLFQAGEIAEKPLRQATKSEDSDVATRARSILESFEWGVFADSDPKLREIVESYKKGDAATRIECFDQLLKLRPLQIRTLRHVLSFEKSPELRQQYGLRLNDFGRSSIPELIRDAQRDQIENILEILVMGSNGELTADYAAWMEISGRVDIGIERFRKSAEAKNESGRVARLALIYLYRIKKEYAKAITLAKIDSRQEILEELHFEAGQWKQLLEVLPKEHLQGEVGYRLYLTRLAGDEERHATLLKELRQSPGKEDTPNKNSELRPRVGGLMLNHLGDEGVRVLVADGSDASFTVELLITQGHYQKAITVLETARSREQNRFRLIELDILRARLLFLFGDREQAIQLFRKFGGKTAENQSDEMINTLVRTVTRLGLKDLACEFVAAYLFRVNQNRHQQSLEPLLEYIFPGRGSLARTAKWALLEVHPKEDEDAIMKRLRKLMEGQGKEDLDLIAKKVDQPRPQKPEPESPRGADPVEQILNLSLAENILDRPSMLAKLYADHGDDENARRYFLRAIEMNIDEAHFRYAEYLFQKRKYAEAATAYHKAAHSASPHNTNKVLALALEGRCLKLLGKKTEGDSLIERAFAMPLANESMRTSLMTEYQQHDWPEAARREAEMILRSGDLKGTQSFGALHFLAGIAYREHDFAKCSEYYLRVGLGVLKVNGSFTEDSGFLTLPNAIEMARGRQLLEEGNLEGAMTVAKSCLRIIPGNIDLAVSFVPKLDRLQKSTEADSIYRPVREWYLEMLKQHPNSAYALNSLAWMMAGCRRELDDALKHAQRAVELEPEHASYLDTLAEVHFRRGEKDKAIAQIKKCISKEPTKRYYRKQLERFENLSRDSIPPEDDD